MERDYPIAHPASSDYAGQKYSPPRAPWMDDFPADHPAFGGKNCNFSDTPDGQRDGLEQAQQDVAELEKIGAFPVDRNKEADDLAPGGSDEQKAKAFLLTHGYSPDGAHTLVARVGASRILGREE